MKKLLFILMVGSLFVGCDYAPTEHTHVQETEDSIIEREFVVVKTFQSASYLETPSDESSTHHNCEGGTVDCNGECDGDAVEQTYYYDYDGDGLGDIDYSHIFCSANVEEGWVLNSDDNDDLNYCISNIIDCADVCDGTAEILTYWYDGDGDGLGAWNLSDKL